MYNRAGAAGGIVEKGRAYQKLRIGCANRFRFSPQASFEQLWFTRSLFSTSFGDGVCVKGVSCSVRRRFSCLTVVVVGVIVSSSPCFRTS